MKFEYRTGELISEPKIPDKQIDLEEGVQQPAELYMNKIEFRNADTPSHVKVEAVPYINLKGACTFTMTDNQQVPIKVHLTSKLTDKRVGQSIYSNVLQLKTVVESHEATLKYDCSCHDEDGDYLYNDDYESECCCSECREYNDCDRMWQCQYFFWTYCLLKLTFFDNKNNRLFTKCLHISQEEVRSDCGCDPEDPNEYCYATIGNVHHGKNTENYESFCCLNDIQQIFQQPEVASSSSKSIKVREISEQYKLRVQVEWYLDMKEVKSGGRRSSKRKRKPKKAPVKRPVKTRKLQDTDMTFNLVHCGVTLPAHRTIVSAESHVLRAMLDSGMIEGQTGEIKVLDESVTKEMFEDFISGLYGDWTVEDMEKNHDNLNLQLERLKLLNYYACDELIPHVVGSIVINPNSSFNIKSALDLYSVGCLYGISCLKFRSLQWLTAQKKLNRNWTLKTEVLQEIREFLQQLMVNDFDVDPILDILGGKWVSDDRPKWKYGTSLCSHCGFTQ